LHQVVHDEREKRSRLKVGLLAGTVVAGLAIAAAWSLRRSPDPPRFLTARVEQGAITSVVQATGTINPLTTVPVGSYVSGTVKYIFADFNSRVHADQVLAQLDPEVYEAQVTQARGNLDNAIANQKNLEAAIVVQEAVIKTNEANRERSKAAAEYARVTAQRFLQLSKDGVISRDQADQLKSGMDQADAQVRAADAQLNQSRKCPKNALMVC
jgi:HlyD family secretion protein